MQKTLSFSHPGTFGDTLYSLCAIKLMGGGDLYIRLNAMNEVAYLAFGMANAGAHAGRYTREDAEFIFPLLKHQSYIKKVDLWRNEPVDFDMGTHYKFTTGPKGWQGNQTECHALICGLDIHNHRKQLLIDPWLDPVKPIKVPGRSIVINRTDRYLQGCDPHGKEWVGWLEKGLEDVAIFVGTASEHAQFNEKFKCNVPHRPVKSMLEAAQLVQGAEQVIANQGMVMTLAQGLGKTYWCEIRKDYDNYQTPYGRVGDNFFPRANAYYF